MKKRLLATIPVLLVVFLCSFNVFADDVPTGTAKQAVADYAIGDYSRALRFETYVTALKPVLVESSFDASNASISIPNFYITSATGHIDNPNTHTSGSYLYYYDGQQTAHWVNGTGSSTTGSGVITFSGTSQKTVIRYDFIYTIMLSNYFNQAIALGDQWVGANFSFTLPSGVSVAGMEINMISENNLTFLQPSSNGTMWFTAPTSSIIDRKTIIPNGATYSCNLCVSIYGLTSGGYVSTFPTYNALTLRSISSVTPWNGMIPDVIYQLYDLNQKMDEFLDAYSNTYSQSSSVENESNSLTNQSDTIHQQESSYYTQTNTALSNTGLSNYTFSSDIVGGMSIVKNHFTYLWNKLDVYSNVFIFSLTLSVALLIIRHVRPIRRKQEE